MQPSFKNITYLVGSEEMLSTISTVKVYPICDIRIVDFLSALSKEILLDKRSKKYPDVTSFAFWIRKSSINKISKNFLISNNRIGRGVSFHIAPSNVPVNFAVSMAYALLAGNSCIVRVSSKSFEQVDIICDAINNLFKSTYQNIKNLICIIRYEYNEMITQTLSSLCDIRVIWGGNHTIDNIRLTKLPPRAIELTFADRYSISIVNSEEYLMRDNLKVARDFYIDTYFSDQNACSSPRLVVWTGNKIEKARKLFWNSLEDLVTKEYKFNNIQCVDKLTAFCKFAAHHNHIQIESHSNLLVRVKLSELSEEIMDFKEGGGYFFEYTTNNLNEIVPILTKSCQTISLLGINSDEIKNIVFVNGAKGVDRIVPMGHTMDISYIWDGNNMIESMSRIIECF